MRSRKPASFTLCSAYFNCSSARAMPVYLHPVFFTTSIARLPQLVYEKMEFSKLCNFQVFIFRLEDSARVCQCLIKKEREHFITQIIMSSNILTSLGNCVSPGNILVEIFCRGYGSCRDKRSPSTFGSTAPVFKL